MIKSSLPGDNTPPKFALVMAVVIGGCIGEYVPSLFGASYFSLWGIVGSVVGAILALWLTWKAFTSWI